MTRVVTSERGVATLIALIMVGMLTLIGIAAMSTSDDEITIAGNELQEMRAFYAAEAGLEKVAATLQIEYDSTGAPPLAMPSGTDNLNLCQVSYKTTDDGPATQEVLKSGSLSGLHALVKSFSITSAATSATDKAMVQLSQTFETALVPIFQFAVFYENDLWATPRYDMDIDGRVHVNGDMHLQGYTKLAFSDRVTASGGIYHGLANKQYSEASGNVYFKDQVGLLQPMYKDGQWLDARDPDWFQDATARWGGRVRDDAFGTGQLNLPLTNSGGDEHKIIERASGNPDSYESKADVLILKGIPYVKIGGVWQDATPYLPPGTVSNSSFYDAREDEWVNSTDIDIGSLKGSGYFPSNGIIYSSDDRPGYNATRLVKGSDIGRPLSVFCENPMYVMGDYNTVNKQPAAIAADAVTFLSNNWNDNQSSKALKDRSPKATSVNVAFITGDSEPTSTNYGGGLENLPRFLENWLSTKFTLRGSMISLWRSKQATGDWSYAQYYTAPTRDWGFDTDFNDPNKLPPGTPCVRVFQRTGWKQEHLAYDGP